MKSRLALLVGVVAAACLLFVLNKAREVFACRSKVASLQARIQGYRLETHGRLPANLIAAVSFGSGDIPAELVLERVTCPGTRKKRAATDPSSAADYIYIDWTVRLGTNGVPDGYPIAYDRDLDNHGSAGVNVLKANGECFWDFRARWLRAFAASHPEFQLDVP